MADIIVAGAGHGGVTAAIKLLKSGHSVKIIEKEPENALGHNQYDSFDTASMEFADIPVLPEFYAPKNKITFIPLDRSVDSVTLPVSDDEKALTVDRKIFIRYLLSLALEAGAEISYGETITAPVMLGSRVAGVVTNKATYYADLIIDAAGLDSPLRSVLPEFTHIQHTPPGFDVLYAYRAYFDRIEGEKNPDTLYNIYIDHDGIDGFEWLVTGKDDVDVLIVRFHPIEDSDILESLKKLHDENPHMGKTLLRGGKKLKIPVRQPLAVFVADGYAAVGDSAFMTYPVKGSGIGYSLRAGTLLAECVNKDEDGLFTAETLWDYEHQFYKKIGFDACRLTVLKALLPYVTAREVSDLFAANIITTEELEKLMSDTLSTLLNGRGIAALREKIKLLNDFPDSKKKLLNVPVWFGKLTVLEPFFPSKYDREDVAKWAARYNEFFESIAYHKPESLQNS